MEVRVRAGTTARATVRVRAKVTLDDGELEGDLAPSQDLAQVGEELFGDGVMGHFGDAASIGGTHCLGGRSCSIGTTIECRRQALRCEAMRGEALASGSAVCTGNEIEFERRRSSVAGLSAPSAAVPSR